MLKTRFYRDIYAEERNDIVTKVVPRLLTRGLSIQHIAEVLALNEATVQEISIATTPEIDK